MNSIAKNRILLKKWLVLHCRSRFSEREYVGESFVSEVLLENVAGSSMESRLFIH